MTGFHQTDDRNLQEAYGTGGGPNEFGDIAMQIPPDCSPPGVVEGQSKLESWGPAKRPSGRIVILLALTYALAAIFPGPGLWMRYQETNLFGRPADVVNFLVAALVLNASFAVHPAHLSQAWRGLPLVLTGQVVRWAIALALLIALNLAARFHLADGIGDILSGLALIFCLPIANSSVAWTQGAKGQSALGLTMIAVSTTLSIIAIPGFARLYESAGIGSISRLAGAYDGSFALAWVVLPMVAGLLLRSLVGGKMAGVALPYLHCANTALILVLNYANAAVSLPGLFGAAAGVQAAVVIAATSGVLTAGFILGWLAGRFLRAGRPRCRSLVFAVGMSNTGLALVLSTGILPLGPLAQGTIVAATLIQHALAALACWLFARADACLEEGDVPSTSFARLAGRPRLSDAQAQGPGIA